MPIRTLARGPLAALLPALVACLAAAACGDDGALAPEPPFVPGGAVSGIRFMDPAYSVAVRARVSLPVIPLGENGMPSLALLAVIPTLRAANPAVLAVGTDGTATGVAPGVTKVYATLGPLVDSAVVTVVGPE